MVSPTSRRNAQRQFYRRLFTGSFERFHSAPSPGVFTCGGARLVHRLAYNGDVAAGQLAVFQGASAAPISGLIRVKRATRKNSQLAAARRGALKMGRRPRCSQVSSPPILLTAGGNPGGSQHRGG